MQAKLPKNQILSLLLLCSLSSSLTLAQAQQPTTTSTSIKTQKYNGYGLPNTKFKKIKVDMTKKIAAPQQAQTTPSIEAASVKLTPKYSLAAADTTTAATSTTTTTAAKSAKPVSFNFMYGLSYNAQMQEQENHARGEYLQHQFMPKMKMGDFSLFGDFYYYDDIKDPSASEWWDSAVVLTYKPVEIGKYFTLGPLGALGLPLQKSSREGGGIKYSLGTTLALGLNTKNMGLEALTLNYTIGYTKYTTEFHTKPNGDPSADYRIRQRVNFGYQFTDKFSFSSRFQYDSGYSNQGVVKNAYYHFEVLEYQFTDIFAASIGHSTGSAVYSITESGNDILFENDLKFYDPKISEIGIGISLSI